MGYDEVIEYIGEFGKYQKIIYFLICLTSISCAFHKLVGVFLLAKPDFRCVLPFEQQNITEFQTWPITKWNLTYAYETLTDKWQTCEYFQIDYTADYLNQTATTQVPNMPAPATTECSAYVYDRTKYLNSAVTEWNLVCKRSFMAAASDSMFMFGVLLGSIVFGQLSDKYGRKPVFFMSLVVQVIFGIIAGIAPDYYTYTLARFIVGATTSGVFLVAYVIAMEMVGPSKRLFAGIFVMMFFSLGFILTTVFVYFVRDWRQLQIALTLPGLLFLSYHWIIPESARWLLSKHRKSEAIAIIQRAARFNKIVIPADVLDNLLTDEHNEKQHHKKASIFDLFKTSNLRRKTLIIFFNWFVNSGTYYGLSWNTGNLGANPLLNFLISGAVEFPAYTFLLFTLNRWGRRSILCGCMLLAGTSLLLTVFVPTQANWLIITLAMIGKLAITASYGTVYIFSAEQFPTVVRNVGLGASSMVARIGGMLAPFCNILADVWRPLPLMIFGGLALVGGMLSLLLPETHNKATLETIADGEALGKKPKKFASNSNHFDKEQQLSNFDNIETEHLKSNNCE